jgi:hypothetical protein
MHTYALMEEWEYRNAVNFSSSALNCQLALYGNINQNNFSTDNKNDFDIVHSTFNNNPKNFKNRIDNCNYGNNNQNSLKIV